jgi:DNA-directed RNA polymerase specialized sigma24 family protein
MTQQELRSSFNDKVKRGLFRPVARHITNLADAEDRLQEAVCMTFEMAARYAERGQVLNDAILIHSCRLRAVDLGRRFVRNDAQPRRDVLHPQNFTQGTVAVYRIDGMLDDDGDFIAQDEVEALVPGLATALQVNPQRDIISAVDLEAWVNALAPADRELLAMRQAGATLADIAEHLDLSISKVFSRLKTLGLILADRAGLPVAGTTPSVA